MPNPNDNDSTYSESSGKPEKAPIYYNGLNPDSFYPLEIACKLAGIGVKHMESIKRKYKGNGIHVWGHDVGCYGRDLIQIFIKESANE